MNQIPRKILSNAKTNTEIFDFLNKKKSQKVFAKVLDKYAYECELSALQAELVNLQKWVAENKKKVAVIFEGRDAAGKGGTIRRFVEHLNPRSMRVVA